MNVIRRIRAMLATAVIWGAAWTVPGLVWVGVTAFLARDSSPQIGIGGFIWTVLSNWTVVGSLSGALLALTLSVAERRRSSQSALSMRRFVIWGAIGGAALPLLVLPLVPIVAPEFARQLPAIQNLSSALRQAVLAAATYGLLGAVSAGTSLRLARRADRGLVTGSDGPMRVTGEVGDRHALSNVR